MAAFRLNVNDPAAVGVPDSTPAALNDKPVGTVPESTVNTGAGDPDAVNPNEYTNPTVAAVGAPEVNSGACVTTIVNGPAVTDPAELAAFTLNVNDPTLVGVPDSTPDPSRLNPSGNDPESTEKLGAGDPAAVNPNEYGDPNTTGDDGAPLVNTGTVPTTTV